MEIKNKKGTVYWLTGLSGAGKTSIGYPFLEKLRETKPNVVYLDGDILREVFGGQNGYTLEDRKILALNYSRFCKMLSDQGIDVICATISMFHEVREWNRKEIKNYTEIYIKVPIEILIERDQKKLYSRALKGETNNVMGIDIPFEEPIDSDIVLINDGSVSVTEIVDLLFEKLIKDKI